MIGVDTATEIKAFRVGPGRGGPAAEPSPEEAERKDLPMEVLMSPLHFSALICKGLMV
jgi:hypothetical protein